MQHDIGEYTPISLTAQRNGGITAKETPSPLLFAPANAVPLGGLKRSTDRMAISNFDRRRSESATVSSLILWLG